MMPIGYKLFRVKKTEPDKLYPLYVFADKEVPVGVWLDAEEGPRSERGKVKSRLGDLAYRPGWHINDKVPYVTHIYSMHDGKKYLRDDCVWCEVMYKDDVDYQKEARERGIHKNGNFIARDAYIEKVPVNGFYRYKTNPQMYGEWIIAGEMQVTRRMSDDEVYQMCREAGLEPLERYVQA